MSDVSLPQIVHICLVRQRVFFLTILLASLLVAAAVTFALPAQYRATATLAVGQQRAITQDDAAAQADEAQARTYADVLRTPAVTHAVARQFGVAPGEVVKRTSAEAVTGTKLIRVTATGSTAGDAQALANTYARVFMRTQTAQARGLADAALRTLATRIRALSDQVSRLRARGAPREELRAARSEQSSSLRSYSALSDKAALAGSDLQLASTAARPSARSRPRPVPYLMVGLVLSLGLAVAGALVRNSFDKRIESDEELRELLGAPVLARVPDRAHSRARWAQVEDAFQLLRLNLQLSEEGHDVPGVIAVVSASRKDGRTTVAARLAAALAGSGADVIAVDCDLREPCLHLEFGIANKAGVVDFLTGAGVLAPPLRSVDAPTLRLLPAGQASELPVPVIDRRRISALFDELVEQADYVIVDTSPITVGADASAVAAAADAALYVADVAQARRDAQVAARDQLRQAGARVVGLVLNRVGDSAVAYAGNGQASKPIDVPLRERR
jgi:capsular exopolysaccharide synthesis family protein